jgi:hypothetical protein
MSAEQYRKLREKEKEQESKKKLGAYGPQSFKSRSLKSFQQDLEKGISKHLLPVFSAKEKLKKGEIRPEDVPYMQRGKHWERNLNLMGKWDWIDLTKKDCIVLYSWITGGSWDNSDVSSAKPKEWNAADKEYTAKNSPARTDWTKMTGRVDTDQRKKGAARAAKAGAANPKPPKKKLFGIF